MTPDNPLFPGFQCIVYELDANIYQNKFFIKLAM